MSFHPKDRGRVAIFMTGFRCIALSALTVGCTLFTITTGRAEQTSIAYRSQVSTVAGSTKAGPQLDSTDLRLTNGSIEIADSGTRFRIVVEGLVGSSQKETELPSAVGDKTGSSVNAGTNVQKDNKAPPSRFSGLGGLVKPDKTEQSAPVGDPKKRPGKSKTAQDVSGAASAKSSGESAETVQKGGPTGSRKQVKDEASKNVKPPDIGKLGEHRGADAKASKALSATGKQAQKGLDTVIKNRDSAADAIEKLAPDTGPRDVDEGFLIPLPAVN